MIRVMVRKEQCLAQNCFSLPAWDGLKQICPRIIHQADHFTQILLKSPNTFFPSRGVGRPRCLWPVAVGKFGRNMFGIAAEFEDVPLCQPGVLQELPSRVWQPFDIGPLFLHRKSFQCVREVNVGSAAFEQINHMLTESRVPPCVFLFCHPPRSFLSVRGWSSHGLELLGCPRYIFTIPACCSKRLLCSHPRWHTCLPAKSHERRNG